MSGPKLAFVVTSAQTDPQVARLGQLLTMHGYTVVGRAVIEDVVEDPQLEGQGDALVLVPSIGNPDSTADNLVYFAERLAGRAFVVFVSNEISHAQYKALVRTGAADCVGWDSALREIVEISERAHSRSAQRSQPSATPDARHVVVSFLGTSGSNGSTTLALETAAALVTARGKVARRVAIVDLNFQRSVMADYFDVTPRLDIGEVTRNPQRLDRYLLDIFTSKHGSGLDIFASDNRTMDLCAIDGRVVFSLLEYITDLYDIVVLDMPSYRTAWVDAVLKSSDLVLVTGIYSVPSAKQIVYELKHLTELELGPDHMAVVINRCQTNALGGISHDGNIEGVLAGRRIFHVREDRAFALECVNTGVSMVQTKPSRAICRDIKKLQDAILAVQAKVTA